MTIRAIYTVWCDALHADDWSTPCEQWAGQEGSRREAWAAASARGWVRDGAAGDAVTMHFSPTCWERITAERGAP